MGEQTFVKMNTNVKEGGLLQSLRFSIDLPLVVTVAALTLFGLLILYSASLKTTMLDLGEDTGYMVTRQIMWVVLGTFVALVLSRINYHFYAKLLYPMVGVTLLLLVVVLFMGDNELGSSRAILGGSVRPSELAKMAIIIYLTFWTVSKKEVLNTWSLGLFPMMAIIGIVTGLILLQPDISAAATVIALGGIMFFLAGGEIRQLVPFLVISMVLGWLVVMVSTTGYNRLMEYVYGLLDPANASFHVQRSMEAVINGGVFGMGIGQGITKWTGLPLASTDSIFAVIAEETGLIGSTAVVLLFIVFLWRGLHIAQAAPDLQGKLLASGLTLWVVMEAIINMGVMVNLFPFAGNTLPFISYSGSSITMVFASIGILLNIVRCSNQQRESSKGRSNRAVVDLRGRNSGRGVSRAVRSASTRQ